MRRWLWTTSPPSKWISRCLPLVSTAVTVLPTSLLKASGLASSTGLPASRGRSALAVRQRVSPSGKQYHSSRTGFKACLTQRGLETRVVDRGAVHLEQLALAHRARGGRQRPQVAHVDRAEGQERAAAPLQEQLQLA